MTKTTISASCVVVVNEIPDNKWNHIKTHNVNGQETCRIVEDVYRVFDIDISGRNNKRTIRKLLDM